MDPRSSRISAIAARRVSTTRRRQMIYDVAKSLHEGHGLSRALYDEAVKMLERARAGRDHRTVRLLHHGVDDAEHVWTSSCRRGGFRS